MFYVTNLTRTGFECIPEKSRNGGSYPQGVIELSITNEYGDVFDFRIEDTSCGWFGTRISVLGHCRRLAAHGIVPVEARYGSMRGDSEVSEFTAEDKPILDYIRLVTGYRIPTGSDI